MQYEEMEVGTTLNPRKLESILTPICFHYLIFKWWWKRQKWKTNHFSNSAESLGITLYINLSLKPDFLIQEHTLFVHLSQNVQICPYLSKKDVLNEEEYHQQVSKKR